MSYQEILNLILSFAKRNKDCFDKKSYYRHLESNGLPKSDTNSFYLTSLKKVGIINNPKQGFWMLTEYGKNLDYIDEEVANRVYQSRFLPSKRTRRVPRKLESSKEIPPVDVASLILEIRKANPAADITKFAVLL